MKVMQFSPDFYWYDNIFKTINLKQILFFEYLKWASFSHSLSDFTHQRTGPRFCAEKHVHKISLKSIPAFGHYRGHTQTSISSLSLSKRD